MKTQMLALISRLSSLCVQKDPGNKARHLCVHYTSSFHLRFRFLQDFYLGVILCPDLWSVVEEQD